LGYFFLVSIEFGIKEAFGNVLGVMIKKLSAIHNYILNNLIHFIGFSLSFLGRAIWNRARSSPKWARFRLLRAGTWINSQLIKPIFRRDTYWLFAVQGYAHMV